MKKLFILLIILLFSLGIIYTLHTNHEYQGSIRDANNGDETASFIKISEFYFFLPITILHFILAVWLIKKPDSQVALLIIIIGIIVIFMIYFQSKNPEGPGVPIVNYDTTTDYKDHISKVLQAILLPIAGYLLRDIKYNER